MANMTIAFILANAPVRTGAFPIMCRITIDRKHALFKTAFSAENPSDFDEVKQCFKKNKEANARLTIIKGELQVLFGQLMHENPTAKLIKLRYQRAFDSKKGILTLLNDFLAHKKADPDIMPQSIANIENKLSHLRNFIAHAKLAEKRANEFGLADIEAYEIYLQGVRKRTGEPLKRRADFHQHASSMFLFGEEKGYMQSNPYKHFKKPKPKPSKRKDYLTIPELHALLTADSTALTESQQYYLLLFLFAVVMGGISFADLKGMKAEHIKDRGGRMWLVKHRQKVENSTGAKLETPFSELAKELYTRLLAYRAEKQDPGTALLIANRHTYFIAIKEAVKMLGIDKEITTHCTRTTFASAMDMLGVKDSIIKASLGHTQGDTLHAHYLQIQDEPKMIAMDRLADAIRNYGKTA